MAHVFHGPLSQICQKSVGRTVQRAVKAIKAVEAIKLFEQAIKPIKLL